MNIRRAPRSGLRNEPDDYYGLAIASLVLGVAGIFLVLVPYVGLLGIGAWIFAIILGITAVRSRGKVLAIVGIVLSSIGLITAISVLILALRNPAGGF